MLNKSLLLILPFIFHFTLSCKDKESTAEKNPNQENALTTLIRSCDLSGEKFERIQCLQYETPLQDASSQDFYDEGTKSMCELQEGKWSEKPCEVPKHFITCESAFNSTDDQKIYQFFEPYYAAYLVEHRDCKQGQELRKQNDEVYSLEEWTSEINDQDLSGSILGEKINSHHLKGKLSTFGGSNFLDIEFYFNVEISDDLCFYYRNDIDSIGATGVIPKAVGTHYMRIREQNEFHQDIFSIMGSKYKKEDSSSETFSADAIKLVLDEVTSTTFRGKILAIGPGSNRIEGNFSGKLCD